MPLKKPDVAKIPKTRKKNLRKLKENEPPNIKDGAEFICKIYFHYNHGQKKQQYCISVQTVKLFSVLNYNLTVEARKKKKEIDVNILGLKTSNNYLNSAGPAECESFFEELYGKHTVNIIKQDGSTNSAIFDINIFKKKISLVEELIPEDKQNGKFCLFEVAEEKFTFQ